MLYKRTQYMRKTVQIDFAAVLLLYCICHFLITHHPQKWFNFDYNEYRAFWFRPIYMYNTIKIQYLFHTLLACVFFISLMHVWNFIVLFHVIPAFQQRFNKKTEIHTIPLTALDIMVLSFFFVWLCAHCDVRFGSSLFEWSSLFAN